MNKKKQKKVDDINKDPFEEYLKIGEPDKFDKTYAWQTAVGLQDVDKLSPSDYLINTAKDNIKGEISMAEAKSRIESYYKESIGHQSERTEEADKVAVRIAEILSEKSFVFSPAQYISIHRRLFFGIYSHAGKIRDYDISKKEWVLDGASVMYGGAEELRPTLEYDFQTEKEFDYSGLTMSEIISHLARFVSNLWQIHIFGEGNTRTTAVFFIKYLRFLGFNVTNDVFAKNAWYFRNSLVRANYTNIQKGVHEDRSFLEIFLKNLLMGENNELKNRFMHIAWKETTHSDEKQHIERHFQKKTDLLSILDEQKVTTKTKTNMVKLYESFGIEKIFGRRDVVEILGITEKPATTLLGKMYSLNLTEKITGAGKGKYRFIV